LVITTLRKLASYSLTSTAALTKGNRKVQRSTRTEE